MKEKRIIYLIMGVSSILILLIGITTAWFTWQSETNTNVTFEVSGLNITSTNTNITGTLYPTMDKNNGVVEEFTIKQNNDISTPVCANITLTLTTLPTELNHESFRYKIYNGTNLIGSGNFANTLEGETITIATSQPITTTLSTYKLYIWIDGENYDNPLSMGGKTFLFKLGITANQQQNACNPSIVEELNAPELVSGMIPIKYDGTNWVKASTNDWYDYNAKKWANAVMVTSGTRDTYMNASTGTTISEEDILAYYVWIPRYKYQLFNAEYKKPIMSDDFITCVDNCLEEQLIEVIFESGTNTTGETRCQVSEIGVETCTNKENGKWYTHPAFTFGDTELEGIWVGKFETSGNATTPTIKPNMTSLTNQNVSTQFITSQKFNSTKYLTKNGTKQTDAHMMKNIEWGAVAYLKQSKYGLGNIDMGMNNYYYCDKYGDAYVSYDKASEYCESPVYHKTGCGDKANREETSFCNAYYTVRGRMASTTGNITGVYDMSGGTDEYVMGVIQDNDTTKRSPMSGYSTIDNSGYIGKAGESYIDSGNTLAFPNLKYYDLYANGSHLGDATGETAGWYKDYVYFVSSDRPWFYRGLNTFNYRQSTGIFAFGAYYGGASDYSTFRSVLSITK